MLPIRYSFWCLHHYDVFGVSQEAGDDRGYLHSSVKMAIALGYCVVCRFDDETRWAAE